MFGSTVWSMSLLPTNDHAASDLFADDPVAASLARLVRELEPGARLPGERDLAEQLNVSRTALRDRLRQLEAFGILYRRGGSGTYVQRVSPKGLTDALNLSINASHLPLKALESVRIALERQAAKEAICNADPVLIAQMRKAVDTMATAKDLDAIGEADRVFHQALLRAAGNPALEFFADALAGVLERDLKDRRSKAGTVLTGSTVLVDLHLTIYDAVMSGDEQAAMRAVDHHFATFDDLLRQIASVPGR